MRVSWRAIGDNQTGLGASLRGLSQLEGSEGQREVSEAQLEGSEAQLEGSEGHLEGSGGQLEWSEAQLEGSEGQPRGDGRTNGRTENLPIPQDFVPYRGRCQKTDRQKDGVILRYSTNKVDVIAAPFKNRSDYD